MKTTRQEWRAAIAGILFGAQLVLFTDGRARVVETIGVVLVILLLLWKFVWPIKTEV